MGEEEWQWQLSGEDALVFSDFSSFHLISFFLVLLPSVTYPEEF